MRLLLAYIDITTKPGILSGDGEDHFRAHGGIELSEAEGAVIYCLEAGERLSHRHRHLEPGAFTG